MALSDAALTTLDTLKDDLGITVSTYDAKLERIIEQASAYIATLTDRPLHYIATRVDRVPGYGTPQLGPLLTPLLSVAQVDAVSQSGDTTVDASTYTIDDAATGLIRKYSGTWSYTGWYSGAATMRPVSGSEAPTWKVTYACGYVTPQQAVDLAMTRTLPYDLEALCLELCVGLYRGSGRDTSVKSRKVLDTSITYGSASEQMASTTLARIDATHPTILAYRRVL